MTLCNAQGVTLCKKKVADLSAADRDPKEATVGICGVCLEIFLSPLCHAQRTLVCSERVIIPNSFEIH